MGTTKTPTPAAVAAEAATAVVEAREVLAQWQTRLVEAEAAVVAAEAVSGDELLDDPERAAVWPAHLRELRDQVEVTTLTAGAQEMRVRACELEWLAAQAVVLEVEEVVPARQALAAHQARTSELLAALEEHDGPYVTQHRLASAQRVAGVIFESAVEWRLPKSQVLEVALARAEVRRSVVAAMAKGQEPTVLVVGRRFANEISEAEAYPECVQASGLLPAPAYAAQAARARALVAELEQLPSELEQEIRDIEDRALREGTPGDVVAMAIERRRTRISEVPAELDAARRELAATVE